MLRVYLAQAMTGRYCDEILKEANQVIKEFKKYGIEVWSPAIEEKIPNKHVKLTSVKKDQLLAKWYIDKKVGLRNCHVMYIASGDRFSRGVTQERGHVRWYLWRPVVRLHEGKNYYSITDIEEDGKVHSHAEAAAYINKMWNSRTKWFMWKLEHILFGIPKFIWVQISSLFLW